jgi:hypothetical protein
VVALDRHGRIVGVIGHKSEGRERVGVVSARPLELRQGEERRRATAPEGDGTLEHPHGVAMPVERDQLLALICQGLCRLANELLVGRKVFGGAIEMTGAFLAMVGCGSSLTMELTAEVVRQGLVGNFAE